MAFTHHIPYVGHSSFFKGLIMLNTKTLRRYPAVLFTSLSALAWQSTASANSLAMDETFSLSAGGYHVFRADTTVSLVSRNAGAGAVIRPADTLGLDLENTVLKVNGRYRFSPSSQVVVSWFKVDSEAKRNLQSDVDWVAPNGDEITLSQGSRVASSMDYEISKASYFYSFYHNEKVELMAGGGLHVSRFAIDIDVLATPGGGASSQQTENAATTIPLPTLGFGLNYRVTPRLHWYLRGEGFYLEFDDWKGLFTDLEVGAEYRLWKGLSVGAGLATNNLTVTETTSRYKFRYDNRLSGAHTYLAWTY